MKIVVLAGGTSMERDVSLVSGKNVYQALRAKGHQVILLDVYLGYENTTENIFEQDVDWIAQIGSISEECPDLEAVKALRKDGEKNFFGPNVLTICQEADVVFMALHGECGEDGKIQAINTQSYAGFVAVRKGYEHPEIAMKIVNVNAEYSKQDTSDASLEIRANQPLAYFNWPLY